MLLVEDFFQKYEEKLTLELIYGGKGLKRSIAQPEVHRAGIFLSGFTKLYSKERLLFFGRLEFEYLKTLPKEVRIERMEALLLEKTPAVILSGKAVYSDEFLELCKKLEISVLRIRKSPMEAFSLLLLTLTEEFAPVATRHGTFIEVYDVGVLIEGDSSIGKSETALGLIEKGHRLVSDDVVRIKKKRGSYLEGQGVELTRHHMEIRGIGILNVANIYGAYCVRDRKKIDIIVKLEAWDQDHFYDRLGLEESTYEILGTKVPFSVLPVKPGRDVVLLIETIALNFRLKRMGYHSARDFKTRMHRQIAKNLQGHQFSE